jgi:hypothetical protein
MNTVRTYSGGVLVFNWACPILPRDRTYIRIIKFALGDEEGFPHLRPSLFSGY